MSAKNLRVVTERRLFKTGLVPHVGRTSTGLIIRKIVNQILALADSTKQGMVDAQTVQAT